VTTAPAVKAASTTMETSAEARLAASGEASSHAAMIEAAEGARASTGLAMRRSKSMSGAGTVKSSTMKPAATIESASPSIESAVCENSAM
jgi:hypothetical protein